MPADYRRVTTGYHIGYVRQKALFVLAEGQSSLLLYHCVSAQWTYCSSLHWLSLVGDIIGAIDGAVGLSAVVKTLGGAHCLLSRLVSTR